MPKCSYIVCEMQFIWLNPNIERASGLLRRENAKSAQAILYTGLMKRKNELICNASSAINNPQFVLKCEHRIREICSQLKILYAAALANELWKMYHSDYEYINNAVAVVFLGFLSMFVCWFSFFFISLSVAFYSCCWSGIELGVVDAIASHHNIIA